MEGMTFYYSIYDGGKSPWLSEWGTIAFLTFKREYPGLTVIIEKNLHLKELSHEIRIALMWYHWIDIKCFLYIFY